MNSKLHIKQRAIYLGFAVVTMGLGLFSRSDSISPPQFVREYVGDVLWALLIFWLIAFVWPKKNTKIIAIAAVAFAFAIELSQLYQADWLNQIRSTRLGGLVLGFGFKWSDFVAYTIGVAAGVWIRENFLAKRLF